MGKEIDRYLGNAKENVLGFWLGEEWYVKQQSTSAAARGMRFLWAGADEEDRERRSRIIKRLSSIRARGWGLGYRFSGLVQELIVFLQTPSYDSGYFDDSEKVAKAREIGQKLHGMTKEAIGEETTDLMQLYHLMINTIDVRVADFLEDKWRDIGG
jgi:hypothetical protein